MPKPTPWKASRTPSHSHSDRDTSADASGEPVHGRRMPMFEVAQRIWAQRGAMRPIAKRGRIQEWAWESLANRRRSRAHTIMKKKTARRAI